MNNLTEFIKSIKSQITIMIICLTSFLIIFKLMNLDINIYYYTCSLITFIVTIYFAVQFFYFKKEKSFEHKYKESLKKIKELENEIIRARNETNEYFIMWVHQIKTPITAAKLLTQDRDNDIRQELIYIENYTNMALNYLKLVNSASDMEFANVILDDIIRKILKRYSLLFINNHISLKYEPIKKQVLTDGRWTSIMIEQIITNAIKYAKGKSVYIYYNSEKNSLTISDTGIGIKKEDIPKIFDRGYSGFNGRYSEKSTGLGLFLVKKISSKLNQKVEVKSVLNEGSSFEIFFQETNLTKL